MLGPLFTSLPHLAEDMLQNPLRNNAHNTQHASLAGPSCGYPRATAGHRWAVAVLDPRSTSPEHTTSINLLARFVFGGSYVMGTTTGGYFHTSWSHLRAISAPSNGKGNDRNVNRNRKQSAHKTRLPRRASWGLSNNRWATDCDYNISE